MIEDDNDNGNDNVIDVDVAEFDKEPTTQRCPRSDEYFDRPVTVDVIDRTGYYDCN